MNVMSGSASSRTGQELYRRAKRRIHGGTQLLSKRPEMFLPENWPAYYTRAATGRATVAFCGYHGWADWYLAANLGAAPALNGHLLPGLEPAGVPAGLRGTALPFRYNRIAELEAIVASRPGELAAIVMEPMRDEWPHDGFLEKVRALADACGAVLVFDEITAGWRSYHGGIHLRLGVAPDLAVFAKAISNGFPMAALIGREEVMEAAQRTFVSSTYWTEGIGPAAALATIEKLRTCEVASHIAATGELVRAGWRELGTKHGLKLRVGGLPALCKLAFEYGEDSGAVMTLFTQEMLGRGYLVGPGFYPTLAHTPETVAAYLECVAGVFGWLRQRINRGEVRAALHGPVAHAGFTRLT